MNLTETWAKLRSFFPKTLSQEADELFARFDAALASLAQSPAALAGEREIRRMLCASYAGALAYMDDGEAQDNRAHPCIDFLRDSVTELHSKMFERAAAALASCPTTQAPNSKEVVDFRIVIDPAVPPGEVVFKQDGREVGRVKNIAATQAPAEPALNIDHYRIVSVIGKHLDPHLVCLPPLERTKLVSTTAKEIAAALAPPTPVEVPGDSSFVHTTERAGQFPDAAD